MKKLRMKKWLLAVGGFTVYQAAGCGVLEQLQQLIPNHTRQPYFRDQTGRNLDILTDEQFYSQMCSTDRDTNDVYPDYMYYSFDRENVHFVVMRISAGWQDLLECDGDCADLCGPGGYALD